MRLRHVVESQQFTVPMLIELFARAREMERVVRRGGTRDYQGCILAAMFYEPSTRTRFSFEAAMHRLGGSVLSTEQAQRFSSEIEVESVEDSIRIVGHYADVIVIRHSEAGGALRAAQVSRVPVINAGDGHGGQHPTQALLDLYTIYRERPIDGLHVTFVGELDRGRTARSLSYLLAKFERVKITFVAPAGMQMQADLLDYLERHETPYVLENDLDRGLASADVIYQTRIRPDRLTGGERLTRYAIDSGVLGRIKPDALILHPLPRTVELDKTVDDDRRALYFRQAENGLYVRMALLAMLLDDE